MKKHPLRAYRAKTGLTLEDLAVRAATTKATISRIELGSRTPSMALAVRLRRVTGLPLEKFVGQIESVS